MDGLLRCSRYSFGPNRLHYCGPDANSEILAYINANEKDRGLKALIEKFRTLYPYLKLIASANDVADPFDDRVVQAYWIGNGLLENVNRQEFYQSLIDDHGVKSREGPKSFAYLEQKIAQHAVPHHSFHVMNIWKRTGNEQKLHTMVSMDSCRISWGKVLSAAGPDLEVETEPLVYKEGKLKLGAPVKKKLIRRLEAETDIEELKPGAYVSIHWDVPCESISLMQVKNLRFYTLQSLAFANQTI